MDKPLWVKDEGESGEHIAEFNDGEGWWAASVKWDGCVHFYHYHNNPFGLPEDHHMSMVDYVHICSLKDAIKRLEELRIRGKLEFGEDWDED